LARLWRLLAVLFAEDLSPQTGTAVVFHRENTSEQKLTLEDLQPATIDALRDFLEGESDLLKGYCQNPLH